MGDAFEPNPNRDRRALRRVALRYALAGVLLLGVCCYGVYWLGATLIELLSSLGVR
jgi:hypothetical protein